MKFVNISIDVEQDLHETSHKGILQGIPQLTRILIKKNIRATFFVTAKILEKYSKIFQELKDQGHEIALHGYNHERFDEIDFGEKKKLLEKSIKIYKKVLKDAPKGFRAPQHSIDNGTITLLKEYGFKYDSSLIPWNFHHIFLPQIKVNFSHNFKKMKIHKLNGLYEIPITSLILPLTAFTTRLLPSPLFKIYLRLINLFQNKIFFMHSWDFIKLENSRLYQRCPLNKFLERFEYTLDYFSKDNKFETLVNLPPIKA